MPNTPIPAAGGAMPAAEPLRPELAARALVLACIPASLAGLSTRHVLEATAERLIDVLDALDADADFEPSLAAVDDVDQRAWSAGADDDREDEHDGREMEGVVMMTTPRAVCMTHTPRRLRHEDGCTAGGARG